jgi:hypothetical protein
LFGGSVQHFHLVASRIGLQFVTRDDLVQWSKAHRARTAHPFVAANARRNAGGLPALLELELTEPQRHLSIRDAAERFAALTAGRARAIRGRSVSIERDRSILATG